MFRVRVGVGVTLGLRTRPVRLGLIGARLGVGVRVWDEDCDWG